MTLDATPARDGWGSRDGHTPFSTWLDLDNDPPVVGVAGEIDLTTCGALRQAIDEALETRTRTLALDFAHVSFMGSTGIRELVLALRRLDRLEIRRPTREVRRTLELTGFDSRVALVD